MSKVQFKKTNLWIEHTQERRRLPAERLWIDARWIEGAARRDARRDSEAVGGESADRVGASETET